MSQEVDVNKVVAVLTQTIADLQLKIALLEARLSDVVESSKGGESNVDERSAGKHNVDAKTKGSS